MLISFFRWLFGYVKFSYKGGFREDFINDCYSAGAQLKNLREENGALTAETRIKTYKKLHRLAFAHGGRVRILKKKGFVFLLSPLKNRWGLLTGALFAVFFILFMGGFIWNITVTGSNRVNDVKIVDYLAQNGFKIGTHWSTTDKERLEISVMSHFEDVAWISINKIGSTAFVEIDETVDKPEMTEKKITNVRAARDGVIVGVTAHGGWPAVKKGDAVTKGDLLISGVHESEVDKKNHYAHASGEVLAQVSENVKLNVSRRQTKKSYLYEKEYKTLYFFGLKIPLYPKKDESDAEKDVKTEYLVINSYRLPLGIITEKAEYYKTEERLISDNELEALAKSALEKEKKERFANCEILSEKVEIKTNDDGCVLTARYSCVADIGEESEILFDGK